MTISWLLSSALLLLALILLRAAAGKRMRPGLRYGLWALALLRLLIPVSFIPISMSLGEVARELTEPLLTAGETYETMEKPVYAGTMTDTALTMDEAEAQHGGEVYKVQGYPADGEKAELHTYFFRDSLRNVLARLLPKLWLAGVLVTAAVFLLENLRLARQLRRRRVRLETDCPLPVYAVEGLDSSCLFGRSIYVSAETARDAAALRHVLAHERSHFRHGDSLWALLRSAALALHWFDPLAWWAAALSRRDSELWADADAVKHLGEGEWEAYGRTLIALSAGKPGAGLLSAATTLSGGKKALRERISMIARRGKLPVWVTVLALLIGLIAALCAFSERKTQTEPVTEPHSLTVAASEGGSFPAGHAALITGEYAAGEEILLTVRPDPGWRFDHWELTAGTVDAETSGDAVFTMPDSNAEVKPVFIPDDAAGQDDSADKAWLRWANDLYAPEAPQVLSEAELQGWTDWLYEDDHRMGFLTSTYLNPAEIDLDELLYTGIGHYATQEEVRAYLVHTGHWVMECPTDVMPRTEVLAYLRQYTGADFGELTLGYNYVPESDCWYHAHGDTNIGGVMLTGGVRCGDEVLLFYREGEFCVTLDVSGEAPRFRKNVACEWDSAGRALETVSRRESASEVRVLTGLAPVFTTEPISYGSHDRAIAALESLTSTVNGKEVPIEIIPDCGAGYHTGGAWKRWPVNGGDPVYGEFREGESAVGALYFVYADGRVLPLPMPGTAEGSCRMKYSAETDEPGAFYLFGEGDLVIWNCVLPEAALLPDETGEGYTSVIYTLFVPTGEVFPQAKK